MPTLARYDRRAFDLSEYAATADDIDEPESITDLRASYTLTIQKTASYAPTFQASASYTPVISIQAVIE